MKFEGVGRVIGGIKTEYVRPSVAELLSGNQGLRRRMEYCQWENGIGCCEIEMSCWSSGGLTENQGSRSLRVQKVWYIRNKSQTFEKPWGGSKSHILMSRRQFLLRRIYQGSEGKKERC